MSIEAIKVKYQELYNEVMTNAPELTYDDLAPMFIELANLVHERETPADDLEDFELWTIGEFSEASLDSFIIGAYWHYVNWHGGQGSDSYAALSALGQVFSPNMASEPDSDEDGSEFYVYKALNEMAEKA